MGSYNVNKIRWTMEVWLCRRFMRNMTVGKVAVLAHVTGVTPEAILALHPCGRARNIAA